MKIISKKEFNRFMKIRNANPGATVMALHRLYEKDYNLEKERMDNLARICSKNYKPMKLNK